MHGSLKTTAHSGLYRDSLTKCSRVRGEHNQKANVLATKYWNCYSSGWWNRNGKNPKPLLLTKPCIRMNKAADACVNLKTGDRKRLSLGFPLATLLSSMVSLQSAIHDLLSYLSIINIYTPRGTELLKGTISFLWGSDSKDRKVITSVPLNKMKRWKKSPNNPTTLIA